MYIQQDDFFGVNGYEIYFTRFANSIFSEIFQDAKEELTDILNNFHIKRELIIAGGGGKSKITQTLEKSLYDHDWNKKNVTDEHFVDGEKIVSESHEIDHYKTFENGSVGLEIEWNNKDPFYDRDLENFRKLHYINSTAIGIIITRGNSLQESFQGIYEDFLRSIYPFDILALKHYLRISDGLAGRFNRKIIYRCLKQIKLNILATW